MHQHHNVLRRKNPSQHPPATRAKRKYVLSPAGRAKLKASIGRSQPWRRSTGPRTEAGKASSSRNALRHGERSGETLERLRTIRATLRILRAAKSPAAVEGTKIPPEIVAGLLERWCGRGAVRHPSSFVRFCGAAPSNAPPVDPEGGAVDTRSVPEDPPNVTAEGSGGPAEGRSV